MAKVSAQPALQNVATFEDLRRFVKKALADIINQVNGNLQFVQNVAAAGPFSITFLQADFATTISHNFGAVPLGFIVINADSAMQIYKAPGAGVGIDWTATAITLQSSAVGTAMIYLI